MIVIKSGILQIESNLKTIFKYLEYYSKVIEPANLQ